ncbi:MAG: arginine--tRNA ligase [Clostridia bacterium]
MKNITKNLETLLKTAFQNAGFGLEKITISPCTMIDMGDFQCNDALSGAKKFGTAPRIIAQKVVESLPHNDIIQSAEVAGAGFINITLRDDFLAKALIFAAQNLNAPINYDTRKTIVDYGGPNVAKPLHVGHLRSGTIGESIKRICAAVGNSTLGDVHFGDWGMPLGMVISELERLHPDWVYFDPSFAGEYPTNPPFTVKEIEDLYPTASKNAKADEKLMEIAHRATFELQEGRRGYRALWEHIMTVSKNEVRRLYGILNIDFELWLGESDAHNLCRPMVEKIVEDGHAKISQGATVVDVAENADKIDIPPCMLLKSDGAITYATTDLATLMQREKDFGAQRVIYIVDKRQDLHFTQVFRTARKTGIVSPNLQLDFAGFGTMNGKDGKPYKTRDGGVMQLAVLIEEVRQMATKKVQETNQTGAYTAEEMAFIAEKVAVSALKFADLSIFRTKDYIFDVEKFCSFEGKTGPYLLYTITRAKSILRKAGYDAQNPYFNPAHCGREIMLSLLACKNEIIRAYDELAPSVLCDYVYKVANLFNSFYNTCNIINEPDEDKKKTWLFLTHLTLQTMEKIMQLLGIETLEKM